jgi:peptide/nickel transport system substrate-binding protein
MSASRKTVGISRPRLGRRLTGRRGFRAGTAAIVAVGCVASTFVNTIPAGSATASGAGSTLVFDRSSDLFGFDPVVDGDQTSISTDLQVYDRLVEVSQNGKKIVPGLASSWTTGAGGLSMTFTLRPGVRFSDGSLLTSADVVFSLIRGTDPSTPYGVLFGNAIKSIVAVGPEQVTINLSKPFSPLLASLSTFIGSIYSEKNFKQWGTQAGDHPLGTGAYMLQSWSKGNQLTLVKNPYYWGPHKPTISTLIFKDVPDANARMLQLQSGAADVIDTVSPNQVPALKQSGNNVDEVYGPSIQLVYLNENYKPFADQNVRLAMGYTLDQQAIATRAFSGLARPALSAFPSGTFFYTSKYAVPYDMAKAKQALKRSGYPKGFTFQLIVPPGNSPQGLFAQIWAASLKTIGITLNIVSLEQTTGYQKWTSQTYQATTNPSYVNDTPDAFEFSTFMFFAQNGYYTGWKSATGSALALQAQTSSNTAVRTKDYASIQKLLAATEPVLPVVDLPVIYASSSKIKGFAPNPSGQYFFQNVRKS